MAIQNQNPFVILSGPDSTNTRTMCFLKIFCSYRHRFSLGISFQLDTEAEMYPMFYNEIFDNHKCSARIQSKSTDDNKI